MDFNIRRRRLNYDLLSEQKHLVCNLIGRSLLDFRLGVRAAVSEGLLFSESIENSSLHLWEQDIGGPYFISYKNNSTIILYYDDFLGSVVAREMHLSIDDERFLDALEFQDQMGFRVKCHSMIDLLDVFNLRGNVITSAKVSKLPINYYSKPIGYDLLGECMLSLNLESGGELIIAGGIRGRNNSEGIRLVCLDSLYEKDLDNLSVIFSCA